MSTCARRGSAYREVMEERDYIDEYLDICMSIYTRYAREGRLRETDHMIARNKAEIEASSTPVNPPQNTA
ncbi:hypothetical protein CL638_00030 [bacterium]|nr:hypothetical protein [bacterium]